MSSLILVLILFVYRKLSFLSFEVSRLPKRTKESYTTFKSDKSLQDIEAMSKIQNNAVTIVMFASPTCAPCHTELIDLMDLSDQLNTPFICLAETSNQDSYESFISNFRDEVDVYPVSEELLEKLNIDGFPTFLLVDSTGNVLIETVLLAVIEKAINTKGNSENE